MSVVVSGETVTLRKLSPTIAVFLATVIGNCSVYVPVATLIVLKFVVSEATCVQAYLIVLQGNSGEVPLPVSVLSTPEVDT